MVIMAELNFDTRKIRAGYDPKNNKEDNLIERIVLSVERGKL